jgi:hypothetical protein
MGRVEATLDALIEEAWRQHQRDPLQLLPAGQRIVAVAEAAQDPVGAAWGWLHQAWGQRFRGDREAAQAALSRAEAAFVPCSMRAAWPVAVTCRPWSWAWRAGSARRLPYWP